MVWFLLAAFNKLLIKIKIMHAIYNPNGYGIFVIFMYTKWGQYTYRTVKEDLLFPVCVKSVQINCTQLYNNIPYQQCFISTDAHYTFTIKEEFFTCRLQEKS